MITITNQFSLNPALLGRVAKSLMTQVPKSKDTEEKVTPRQETSAEKEARLVKVAKWYEGHLTKLIQRRGEWFEQYEEKILTNKGDWPNRDELGMINHGISKSRISLKLPESDDNLPKEVADRFIQELNNNLPRRKAELMDKYYEEVVLEKDPTKSKEAEGNIRREIGQIRKLEYLYKAGLYRYPL